MKGQNNFWLQNAFLTFSWRFLLSYKLEQLEFRLQFLRGDLETCRKSWKRYLILALLFFFIVKQITPCCLLQHGCHPVNLQCRFCILISNFQNTWKLFFMFTMDKIIPVSIALSVPSNETSSCFSTIIMLSSVFTSCSIARFHELETTETWFYM